MNTLVGRASTVRCLALTILVCATRILSGCASDGEATVPVINTLTPAAGAPGATVLLQGTHFGASKGTVAFQDKDLTYVTAPVVTWTDTAIVVTAPTMPSGSNQTVNVGLQTAEGQVPAAPATFNVTTTSGS